MKKPQPNRKLTFELELNNTFFNLRDKYLSCK